MQTRRFWDYGRTIAGWPRWPANLRVDAVSESEKSGLPRATPGPSPTLRNRCANDSVLEALDHLVYPRPMPRRVDPFDAIARRARRGALGMIKQIVISFLCLPEGLQ
jgi:hypothetical protein